MSAPRVKIKNNSGETIPARSFVQVESGETLSNNETVYVVTKPDGTVGSMYFVTGGLPIANNKYGSGYDPNFGDAWVKHSSAPTPIGDVGPASGSFELSGSETGFKSIKVDSTRGLTLLRANGGGGGGGPIIIRFSIIYAIPSERYAVCFPTSAPDGYTFGVDTNIPGADDSGQITIYDRVGCWLDDNDPAVFIDREGYAVYLRSTTTAECEDAYSDGGLGWEMTSLCCDTTVCEG